ncbi:MAG: DUF72 domain-containing protein [Desulfurivibrionaceae bacterium]
MKIHVGTSGFAFKEWKGLFYPEKIPNHEMLRFYSERLGAVEINYTFYHMPTEKLLASWSAQVPEDFSFAFKAPRVITHIKRLRDVDNETDYFFRTLAVLGQKMGAVLFQFPKSFRVDLPLLENFLELIPLDVRCAFEFRSPSWLVPEIFDLLRKRKFCLCTPDVDGEPPAEIIATAPWGYLRLRRSDYTEADLEQWLEKVLARKWRRAFVFFKHEEGGVGAEFATRFHELAAAHAK